MTDDTSNEEDEVQRKFEEAIEHEHPEEDAQANPFRTDGLGNKPADEDASGGDF